MVAAHEMRKVTLAANKQYVSYINLKNYISQQIAIAANVGAYEREITLNNEIYNGPAIVIDMLIKELNRFDYRCYYKFGEDNMYHIWISWE